MDRNDKAGIGGETCQREWMWGDTFTNSSPSSSVKYILLLAVAGTCLTLTASGQVQVTGCYLTVAKAPCLFAPGHITLADKG